MTTVTLTVDAAAWEAQKTAAADAADKEKQFKMGVKMTAESEVKQYREFVKCDFDEMQNLVADMQENASIAKLLQLYIVDPDQAAGLLSGLIGAHVDRRAEHIFKELEQAKFSDTGLELTAVDIQDCLTVIDKYSRY